MDAICPVYVLQPTGALKKRVRTLHCAQRLATILLVIGEGMKIKSCASIFAERGDPWVSEKEGLTQYGRNMWSENPDLDQFTLAKKAPEHREQRPCMKANTHGVADAHRRKAMIARRLNKLLK